MYFVGTRNQRGHGLAGLFRSVLRIAVPLIRRTALPILKRTAKTAIRAAGKQALTSGAALAGDLMAGKSFKTSVKSRGREGLTGIMSATKKAVMGSADAPPGSRGKKRKAANRTPARKTKIKRKDIFSG